MAKPKLVISIEASEWTPEGVESFIESLDEQLSAANMASGDDALVTGWRVEEEPKKPMKPRVPGSAVGKMTIAPDAFDAIDLRNLPIVELQAASPEPTPTYTPNPLNDLRIELDRHNEALTYLQNAIYANRPLHVRFIDFVKRMWAK